MDQKTLTLKLSVLLLRADTGWVAQCLEYDFVAQGKTIPGVKEAFSRALVGQVLVDIEHKQEPLSGFAPAPQEYWDKFKQAERLVDRQPIIVPAESLPPAFMIHAVADDLRVCA
jgi:hypothetical protein